jgi:hypothetical protein
LLPDHGSKSLIDVPFTAGTQEIDLLTNRSRCGRYVSNVNFGSRTAGVHQHSDTRDCGCEFAQKRKSLHFQLGGKETHPGHVATRLVEACHQAEPHWIIAVSEDDRNRCRRGFGSQSGPVAATRDDQCHLLANQLSGHRWQLVILAFGKAIFDPHILTIIVSSFAKTITKSDKEWRKRAGRRAVKETDHRHCCLLRARRERLR